MICQKSRKNNDLVEEQKFFILPNSKYSIRVLKEIDEVRLFWQGIQEQFPTFFHCGYLSAIQKARIEGLSYRYIIVFDEEKVVGFIPLQIKDFDAKKHILNLQKEQHFSLRSQVSNFIKFHSVVNGNILVSGPYMYAFTDAVPVHLHWELNQLIISYYQQNLLTSSENNINFTLIKDIPLGKSIQGAEFNNNYTSFSVEPVMKLPIDDSWTTMENYLEAMTSKYRVRYRRAIKKLKGITSRILSFEEVIQYRDQIYHLYKNVLNNVNFTLFELSKDYFPSLAHALNERYVLKGYFYNDQLIGFYTLIHNHKEVHADYLGYSKEFNKSKQLYLNMLYNMVEYAISHSFDLIDFGRTALEIKSSIGAIPYQMNDLIKHRHQFTNIIIPKLLQILNKETEWVQRHPFKKT